MLVLHLQAPFAAFRPFVAGSFRHTSPFITPSSAYGLLLNLAGIESRVDDGVSSMTLMREDLPTLSLAIGMIRAPQMCSTFQQLHNYPITGVGKAAGLARSKGAKYNIQPVRREVLCDVEAYLAVDGNESIEDGIRGALSNGLAQPRVDGTPRYGVPFLGDNSYMIDRIDIVADPVPAQWYCRLRDLTQTDSQRVRSGTCRMTIWVDRADMTHTVTDLYVPQEDPDGRIPSSAWTRIPPIQKEGS